MKKLGLLLLTLTICFFTSCHKKIWEELNDLDSRVTKLEELCKEMNTNITSLQTIVSVLQSNDFITSIVEIKKDGKVVGYTITFGKHDPITIYHGQDGKDGADGKDGQDGQNGSANAPVIGVAQDTDGVYYWTLNGEWLLDDNGNKLPVSGTDGKDGQNGSNGQNGVTPQLKIEEGYWYVSYDKGKTWVQLGKAVGENGQDGNKGDKGDKGEDGDSMFQSVTQDENYVYFTLADGTVIKIAKGNNSDSDESMFYFSVSDSTKVYFSKGNLRYQASTKTFRFAENQWDCIGVENKNMSDTYDGWIDLFAHGTGEFPTSNTSKNPFVDWGINIINNDLPNTWRTLSINEYAYLIKRKNRQLSGIAFVHGIQGLVLLPDTWSLLFLFTSENTHSFTDQQWKNMEENGAVFLPAAGSSSGATQYTSLRGYYWASNNFYYTNTLHYLDYFDALEKYIRHLNGLTPESGARHSVRLVKDVE